MAELDIENHAELETWLRAHGHISSGANVRINVLPGGVSNKTVLVQFADGRQWVIKQALAKLRVKDDWYSDVRRIRIEASGLRFLARLAPPGTITPLVFESPQDNVLAMQAVPQPHQNLKAALLAGDCPRDSVLDFAKQLGRLLGTIQRNAQRDEVREAFADRSFFETLRLDPYYTTTALRAAEASEFYADLIRDTRATRSTLVHGDFSPKNVLIYDGTLILLDHEVIHFGDGAFDVGFALTHLLAKSLHIKQRRADYRDAAIAFWQSFTVEQSDADEVRCMRHTLGCSLARVLGKSPLEYLSEAERNAQQRAVLAMMKAMPGSIERLIHTFVELTS